MKILYVGDCHAKPDCLDEMSRLIDLVCQTAAKEKPDLLVFLGDQFHTHSILHLSVIAFWKHTFDRMHWDLGCKVVALVGNHDMSGRQGDVNHSMMLFKSTNMLVVDKPITVENILFLPYYSNPEEFVKAAQESTEGLVCHQTFDGSQYENGFYAKEGVSSDLVPQKWVVSGHIHAPQTLGKVWYPGSPRWQSISDANTNRAIWLVDHTTGERKSFDTSKACTPIYAFVDREEEPLNYGFETPADVLVDIYGTPTYVTKRTAEFTAKGARVRAFPIVKTIKVKESDGLAASFGKFVKGYSAKNGTTSERLFEIASQRISWLNDNTV